MGGGDNSSKALNASLFQNLGFLFVLLLLLSFSLPLSIHAQKHHQQQQQQSKKKPMLFTFGDSNTDTGGLAAGLGYLINLPNGRAFFNRSTGRISDGRLVIDFLWEFYGGVGRSEPTRDEYVGSGSPIFNAISVGESLNTTYLSPYLDSLGSHFINGANFAIVGSSTLPKDVPFALNIQLMQFLHFKNRSVDASYKGLRHYMDEQAFHDALYLIDIGQNDLADSFKNLSYAEVVQKIPLMLTEVKLAVNSMHASGGRNFWIHNTGPLGCLPQKLVVAPKKDKVLDSDGCIKSYNDAAKLYNDGLRNLTEELRTELKDATIVYVDIYSIKHDLIVNSTKYGFENPLMACCGGGGPPYNYDSTVTCGHVHSGFQVCKEGSKYISWDGTHYMEAANTIVASKILSTNYSTPQLKFEFFLSK